ncbi:MAG: Rieske 2Fe-2S domain-containing protein [Halioglobus sp.]
MAIREKENDHLPIPNGWHAMCWSHELHTGEVMPMEFCGEDLVLFRSRSGEARVLDAFCPHMGTHLGYGGRVIGDTVRCPYHAWQFDGATGECTHIPYCEEIPDRANLKAWHVRECNNLVYCWYHAEGAEPQWEVPVLEEFNGERSGSTNPEDWAEPVYWIFDNPAHVQDGHENNLDPAHVYYLHGAQSVPLDAETYKFVYQDDSPAMSAFCNDKLETPYGPVDGESERVNWNIGLGAIRMRSEFFGFTVFFSTRPVNEKRSISYVQLTSTNNVIDAVGGEIIARFDMEIPKDVEIWTHKVYRDKPVLCQADRPLAEYRKWCKQFYCDQNGDDNDATLRNVS